MRVAIFAALALATAAFVACADDPPGAVATSSDAGDSGTGSSTDDDAGKRAPSGCLLKSTPFMVGAKVENVARTDVVNTAEWTNLDGARSDDGKFATVTLEDGQESATLRVSDFAFAIPAGAETWGISVNLRRQAPDGGVADAKIDVEIESKATRSKLMETPWPKSAMGTHEYGQDVDTWGADIVPADFNRTSFAAKLAVKRVEGVAGPATGIVDSLTVSVHYCPDPAKK